MPLVPSFTLKLDDGILPGLVVVGKYDGTHPCLTAATSGGKVFIHDPFASTTDPGANDARASRVRYLNINKEITSLAAGAIDPASPNRDLLLVGSATDVLAYDVEENKDAFFKEAPDGANAVVCGKIGSEARTLALVGGNCSILGFDHEGEEAYWTVSGDNVNAMTLADVDGDGLNELFVCGDDFTIRLFRDEEVVSEITESERVINVCHLKGERFGYALANGTVGVYDGTQRQWRVKSKNQVTALCAYDLDGDGERELVIGWSSGLVAVRNESDGELVYKDTFDASIAAFAMADYRMDGTTDLIACAVDGEVRGYRSQAGQIETGDRAAGAGAGGGATAAAEEEPPKKKSFMDKVKDTRIGKKFRGKEVKDEENITIARPSLMAGDANEQTVAALNQRRQDLLVELNSYERNAAAAESGATSLTSAAAGAIPRDTDVVSELEMNEELGGGELVLSTNNDAVIKAVNMYGEGVFEEEARFVYFPNPKTTARVFIRPPRDICADVSIKVLVSARMSSVYHVFELEFTLPKFCMYARLNAPVATPSGSVSFRLPGVNARRMATWIDDAFNTNVTDIVQGPDDDFECGFVSLRDGRPTLIDATFDDATRGGADAGGTVTLRTDDMDLAGDIVQELCAVVGVTELESTCDFPEDMERFRETLREVDERNADRARLAAEVADGANLVKSYIIRAEDARILRDMDTMMRMYNELMDVNRELIAEHNKRAENHQALLAALRRTNQMIQRAAKLRCGGAKTRIVSACRAAIKANNVHALFNLIQFGVVD